MKARWQRPCARAGWHRVPASAEILAFWNAYKAWNNAAPNEFFVGEFGDSPALTDHLTDLIRRGIKTATSSSYQIYLDENEALPAVGSFFVAVDSRNAPVCIYQLTDVRVGPFASVDAEFAFDEGEDDRSLAVWQRAHRRFFGLPEMADEESFLVVFERFLLVWPVR